MKHIGLYRRGITLPEALNHRKQIAPTMTSKVGCAKLAKAHFYIVILQNTLLLTETTNNITL